jgi:hypothetical protein
MAHPEQREFFNDMLTKFPYYFHDAVVLEVGSLDINGTVRDFFFECAYTGVDLEEGPGVDVVGQGQELDYPDRHFDVVVSAECFEHNPHWWETFVNMTRMCRGLVLFTCATHGRAEHGTSRTTPANSPFTVAAGWDYYRNLGANDFSRAFLSAHFSDWNFAVNQSSHDLYFWGLVK